MDYTLVVARPLQSEQELVLPGVQVVQVIVETTYDVSSMVTTVI